MEVRFGGSQLNIFLKMYTFMDLSSLCKRLIEKGVYRLKNSMFLVLPCFMFLTPCSSIIFLWHQQVDAHEISLNPQF